MSHPTPDRRRALEASLREAGLLGRVRIGMSPDPSLRPEPRPLDLDAVLRPLEPRTARLIELSGPPGSGRTALAYRLAAGAAATGGLVAWIDPGDALDPRFLRRTGLDLRRLLWVRPQRPEAALRSAELLLRTGFALVVLDLDDTHRLSDSVWPRLLRAVRGTRGSAVLIARERITGASATLGLETTRAHAIFDRGLFEGLEGFATIVRNRTGAPDAELPFRVLHRP